MASVIGSQVTNPFAVLFAVRNDDPMLSDAELSSIADRLLAVSGIVGVTLGGSRARGAALPESDVDLGLYYRGALDIEALAALAREL